VTDSNNRCFICRNECGPWNMCKYHRWYTEYGGDVTLNEVVKDIREHYGVNIPLEYVRLSSCSYDAIVDVEIN